MDTAKYTQFYTLQRLCTFTKDLTIPKLSSHLRRWRGKGRRLRRDLSEVFSRPLPAWRAPNYKPLPPPVKPGRVRTTLLIKTEPIWPLAARIASSLGETSVPLFLGGHPQVWFLGSPRETTQHNPINHLPPRWFINLVVILTFQKSNILHSIFPDY